MGTELSVQTQEERDHEAIRTRFRVTKERFPLGVQFAELIVEGESRKRAYERVFKVDNKTAESRAGNLFRNKWIQELIRYMRPDEDTLYIGEIDTIIKRAMGIIRDGRSSPREITEAMKAVQPYIKQQQIQAKIEVEHSHEVKPADAVMSKMQEQIEMLSKNGKMVNESGDIVDVEVVK